MLKWFTTHTPHCLPYTTQVSAVASTIVQGFLGAVLVISEYKSDQVLQLTTLFPPFFPQTLPHIPSAPF